MEQPTNPYIGKLGWCHQCETFQLGDQARWLRMWWSGEKHWDWACIHCDGEPWGLGVWEVGEHWGESEELRWACQTNYVGYGLPSQQEAPKA